MKKIPALKFITNEEAEIIHSREVITNEEGNNEAFFEWVNKENNKMLERYYEDVLRKLFGFRQYYSQWKESQKQFKIDYHAYINSNPK